MLREEGRRREAELERARARRKVYQARMFKLAREGPTRVVQRDAVEGWRKCVAFIEGAQDRLHRARRRIRRRVYLENAR